MSIIEVSNLTKNYGHHRGVFSATLNVEKGEVFGFLGPNGAGKTTVIRHLMGFSNPDQGTATILGLDSYKQASEILQHVGYLPGEIALPEGLTGMEFIRLMQGLQGKKNEERLKYLLDKFQLDPRGKTKKMSLGNKRKLAVVTAFMADPDILILDEPTSGLDPVMQERFIDFLKEERQRGKTIFLSSHMFTEINAVCDRVAIIKDGEIVSSVAVDDIRHNQNKSFEITFFNQQQYNEFINKHEFVIIYSDDNKKTLQVNINDREVNKLVRSLVAYKIMNFKEEKFSLEKYFLHFYEKDGGKTNEQHHHVK